jgi:hypothetical protein
VANAFAVAAMPTYSIGAVASGIQKDGIIFVPSFGGVFPFSFGGQTVTVAVSIPGNVFPINNIANPLLIRIRIWYIWYI